MDFPPKKNPNTTWSDVHPISIRFLPPFSPGAPHAEQRVAGPAQSAAADPDHVAERLDRRSPGPDVFKREH